MRNLPIAVLISGGGTTLRNLLAVQQLGKLNVDFRLVISSRPDAQGLGFARQSKIETRVVSRKGMQPTEHRDVIFELCRQFDVSLVVMGGYLEHLLIAHDFENRVINIHPSLIPAFCGKGFYGLRVHQAVIDYGAKVSGCTVHFVDNQFDHGPIIAQATCRVLDGDTPQSLQQRVFEEECRLYPQVVQAIASGCVSVAGRRVSVKGASS